MLYWGDGKCKVLCKYSPNNLSNSKSDAVLLYNRYYNNCLYIEPYMNEIITYEDCNDNAVIKYIKTSQILKRNDKCINSIR